MPNRRKPDEFYIAKLGPERARRLLTLVRRVDDIYAQGWELERNDNNWHIAFRNVPPTVAVFGVGVHPPHGRGRIGPYFKVTEEDARRIVIPGYQRLPYNGTDHQIEYIVEEDSDPLTAFNRLFQAAFDNFERR